MEPTVVGRRPLVREVVGGLECWSNDRMLEATESDDPASSSCCKSWRKGSTFSNSDSNFATLELSCWMLSDCSMVVRDSTLTSSSRCRR